MAEPAPTSRFQWFVYYANASASFCDRIFWVHVLQGDIENVLEATSVKTITLPLFPGSHSPGLVALHDDARDAGY
ncbi:hypothetical protein PoB_002898400 [Plakobranchus ocellatus]|uniref:Uncharacterized protein n=1 Tax=Plakobranchus ocellatus TaxID=259542 RepID=A0AAV4A471_9GAST|nr:hypothetical protein PoB_002898400 [Plakobranchus ocellatus]